MIGPQRNRRREKGTEVEIERSNWIEEGVKNYQEKCEGWSCTQHETVGIWKEIKEKVKDAITKQKEDNTVEIREKRLVQQGMEGQEKGVKKSIERIEKKKNR